MGSNPAEGRGWSSLVFVARCVGSDLCDKLIVCTAEFCRLCVIQKPQQRDGLGSIWAAGHRENKKKKNTLTAYTQVDKSVSQYITS